MLKVVHRLRSDDPGKAKPIKKIFGLSAQSQSLQESEDDEHCRETASDQHSAERVLHIVFQHFIITSPRNKGAKRKGKKEGDEMGRMWRRPNGEWKSPVRRGI